MSRLRTFGFAWLAAIVAPLSGSSCSPGDCHTVSCAEWSVGPASATFQTCVENVGEKSGDLVLLDADGDEVFRCTDKTEGIESTTSCPDDFANAQIDYCSSLPPDPSGSGGTGSGGTGSGGMGAGGTGAGGTGGCSADLPVACPAHGGAVPGCWPAGTACESVVACPGGDAACPAGQAMDCGANVCLPVVPSFESSDGACDNGMDDDGNGYIDCEDFHCLTNPLVSVCGGETTDDRCSNMMDDDGNGFADCADISCRASPSVTVCGTTENTDAECNNTLDDDGNNYTDCLDLACVSSAFTSICP